MPRGMPPNQARNLFLGLGLLLATLNVFFRDIGHATGIVLQFAFWFTPIVYPLSIVPEWARDVLPKHDVP